MSLNYDKSKRDLLQGSGSWRSYSYIATVTSLLFLLLYIVAVVRQTSIAVSEKAQNEKKGAKIAMLQEKVQDLEKQKLDLETQSQKVAQIAVLRRQIQTKREELEQNDRNVESEKKRLEHAIAQLRRGKLKRLSLATKKKIANQVTKLKEASRKRLLAMKATREDTVKQLSSATDEITRLSDALPRSPATTSIRSRVKGPGRE